MQTIKKLFYRPPFVGLLAFIVVFITQGLGHTLMVLVEQFFGSDYQFQAAFILGLIGTILLFIGMKNDKEVPATWLGYFAGFFLWTGWVEFSFVFYADYLNIVQILPDGSINKFPEYLVMQSSIGVLMTSLLYFFFNRETKCNFFRFFQRNMKLSTGKPTRGYKRNYAAVTAMETVYVIWFFYIVLLLLYEDSFVGDRHPLTYAFFFINTAWSLYLLYRLSKFWNVTRAIRYAIPTAIIAYTSYEIIGRWGILVEFWVYPKEYMMELAIIIGAISVGILIAIFTPTGEKEKLYKEKNQG